MNFSRTTLMVGEIGLPQLLAIADVAAFADEIWESRIQFAPGALARVAPAILSLDEFETLISASAPGSMTALSVVDGFVARPVGSTGQPINPGPVYAAYCSGRTLLLSGLHLRWPPISRVCRTIENELVGFGIPLAHAVGANAYLTPANAQGFGIHYDDHCAIVVQLSGSKHWTLFAPQEELPTTRCEKLIPRAALGEPLLETSVHAGDVLYIPRGFPHYARSSSESSLHVTLSLFTVTWVKIVEAASRTVTAFRRSVRTPASDGVVQFERDLWPKLDSRLVSDIVHKQWLESISNRQPLPAGRLAAIDVATDVGYNTFVKRVPLVECVSTLEGGEAVLRAPGMALNLHATMKPVFDFVAATERFAASDLPDAAADYDALEFTRILVRHGVVVPVTPQSAERNERNA
jgi:Cupin superfamily protein